MHRFVSLGKRNDDDDEEEEVDSLSRNEDEDEDDEEDEVRGRGRGAPERKRRKREGRSTFQRSQFIETEAGQSGSEEDDEEDDDDDDEDDAELIAREEEEDEDDENASQSIEGRGGRREDVMNTYRQSILPDDASAAVRRGRNDGADSTAGLVRKSASSARDSRPNLSTLMREASQVEDEDDILGPRRIGGYKGVDIDGIAATYANRDADDDIDDEDLDDDDDYEHYGGVRDVESRPLPTVHDPKLFAVKCKRGDERAVCVRFLRKFRSEFARSNVRDPQAVPFICSIVAIDEMRGTLYIEAQDDRVLKSCLRGVGGVSTMRMRLVPLDERTVAMDVGSDLSDAKNSKGKAKTEIEFKAGQFVRYRRGIYKGDLAQVIRFDTEKLRVVVRVVPRIDLSQAETTVTRSRESGANRPPKRLVKRDLFGRRSVELEEPGWFLVDNRTFDDGGFEIQTIPSIYISGDEVNPTLDELEFFVTMKSTDRSAGELSSSDRVSIHGDTQTLREALAATTTSRKSTFHPGDRVAVVSGQFSGARGTVQSLSDAFAVLRLEGVPNDSSQANETSVEIENIEKLFVVGDHCKVLTGKNAGETGLVVKVDDRLVTLTSDLSQKHIVILRQDLQLSREISAGIVVGGKFSMFDLVRIDANTSGVIFRMQGNDVLVLDIHGQVQKIPVSNLRFERGRPSSLDGNREQFKMNDIVRVEDGPNTGRVGTVKHIFRQFVFLHSRDHVEHGGVFVARSKNVKLKGGRVKSNATPGAMNPPLGFQKRRRQKDPLLFQQVRIVGAHRYKGFTGLVRDVNNDVVKVELQAELKVITLPKAQVQLLSEVGNTATYSFNAPLTPSWERRMAPRTPMGSTTPSHDFLRTPGRESMPYTPTASFGSDAWDASITNTPYRSESSSYSFSRSSSDKRPTSPYMGSTHEPTPELSTFSSSTPSTSSTWTPQFSQVLSDNPANFSSGQLTASTPSSSTPGYLPYTFGRSEESSPFSSGTPLFGSMFSNAASTPYGSASGLSGLSFAAPTPLSGGSTFDSNAISPGNMSYASTPFSVSSRDAGTPLPDSSYPTAFTPLPDGNYPTAFTPSQTYK